MAIDWLSFADGAVAGIVLSTLLYMLSMRGVMVLQIDILRELVDQLRRIDDGGSPDRRGGPD